MRAAIWRRLAWAILIAWAAAAPSHAQQGLATLVADRITVSSGGAVVTAAGNVEILYEGLRVKADSITYERATDEITLTGDVIVTDAETGAILTGEGASFSSDFETGLIQGARFLLDEQLQIAATEFNRVDGRYNQLYQAVASSCRVCGDGPPLWQIRAKRVIHDQEARQLYFENAQFEVAGIPVAYFPRLRLPDPTLRRSTGFLFPDVRNSTTLGVGLRMPYFIVLGDHSDLLLTPYVSSETRTLEARYRKEFSFGSLVVEGAVSEDTLTTDDYRAYVFAKGRFELPADFRLNVDLRAVTDPRYLLAYDYSGADRLSNSIEITRTKRDEYISVSAETLESLRAAEIPIEDTITTLLGRAVYERRLFPGVVGGELRLTFDLEGYERAAETVTPALDIACIDAGVATADCTARDGFRAGALADWRRGWTWTNGMQSAVETSLAADFYWINQDPNFDAYLAHVTPTAAVELRWPMTRTNPGGGRDFFEPIVQLAWTDTLGADVPNEDSKLVEFDEGNLLALSRFPGSDRYERGWRATLGTNFSRFTPRGDRFNLTLGRVFRLEDLGQFTAASGLDGASSDWLVAGQMKTETLTLTNRSLFDDSLNFSKSTTQLAWHSDRVTANVSYIWVIDDPAEGRTGTTNEINFDADYRFERHWSVNLNGRYDGNAGEATQAGLGLGYSNECVNIDFSVSRRFISSSNVAASTDYGLTVSLNGFGQDGRANTRACRVPG